MSKRESIKSQLAKTDELILNFERLAKVYPSENAYLAALSKLHSDRVILTTKIGKGRN